MAQVLAPIVQTSGTITMPYPSPDGYQNAPSQSHTQQRSSQTPRNQTNNAYNAGTGYRGTSAPIAPYAFSTTPQLRQDTKASSGSAQIAGQQPASSVPQARLGHMNHPSSSSDSTVSTSGSSNRSLANSSHATKDDTESRKHEGQPSALLLSTLGQDSSSSVGGVSAKPSPGRYRRSPDRTDSSNSLHVGASTSTPRPATSPLAPASPAQTPSTDGSEPTNATPSAHSRTSSADDTPLPRTGGNDAAKRYRRRSFGALDGNSPATNAAPASTSLAATHSIAPGLSSNPVRPSSSGKQASRPSSSQSHDRHGSTGSTSSSMSRSQARPEMVPPRTYASVAGSPAPKPADTSRRHAPSPLSHPMSPSEAPSPALSPTTSSAAVKQLTAVNDKDKGVKSRLRRAFSFGSAAELRRASAENSLSAERAKLRKDKYQNEEDAEQAAIIAKQEAAGIGAGIYSGQGGMGSTDNLSISSAASSASIMLRKMGHGMRKSTKSIRGLFRPKSVIGVPAADGPVTKPSVGEVSLVTVEAERQKVNINADPHDHVRGGTAYPRLERNSIDAGRSAEVVVSSVSQDSMSRKSIIGNDQDRAEILSSMKKGILKRNGTNSDAGSPVLQPADTTPTVATTKAPVLSNEKSTASNEDYFAKAPRIPNGSTRSLPSTPQGSLRNITFSPRIQFHDAWSPQDYDRRGDIATCNRLTPMLAQQIKEELNSFKMEMEVHELSKPHTHFF